ncbi:HAMP domain-containing protein [Sulfurimonas sp. MAG313]|nr:ATP-binding protein [Sulfurimonas sp. MAG313]MDF1881047.1 HAMP domain-containing protein [Sulfurimonas sp. MAG313]
MFKSLLKFWNDLKIGIRLTIGVATTLILTLIVGIIGWATINSQSNSQKLANASTELVTYLHIARKDEKNFMLTSNPIYIKKTLDSIEAIREKVKILKKSVNQENKDIFVFLIRERDKYQKEFEGFVSLNLKKEESLNKMVIQGRALEHTAVILRNDQKNELQRLETLAVNSSDERQEKSEKADDANRMIKLMGEARQQEKNFLLRSDRRYADETRNLVDKLITQAQSTKSRFVDKQNKLLADLIIKTAEDYLSELEIVADGKRRSSNVHKTMVKLGREVEERSTSLREDQKLELIRLETQGEGKLGEKAAVLRLDKRKKADTANRIIKLMGEARQQEKNFLLRKEHSYAEVTISLVNQMLDEVIKLRNSFEDKENKALATKIIEAGEKYIIEFNKVVKITQENTQAQDTMASLGRRVEDRAAQLRGDQKQELIRLEKLSTGSSKQRLDKRIKADTANKIIKLMGEARQQEKNFLLRHENAYIEFTRTLVTQAARQAQVLKDSFEDEENRLLADKITAAAQTYLREFENVVLLKKEQALQQEHMFLAAREIERIVLSVKENTQNKASEVRKMAINVIVITLSLALVLGILVTWFLTKSISNPISELIHVINKLSQEDDVEVPLVNNKDEIGQIARAISNFKEVLLKRKAKTEAQLIEAEKMAALGDLVAGVAHEINTPIGIAVTGSSHLQDQIKKLETAFDAGKLRKAEFRDFVENALPTASTIQSNLERASSLIKSFKQVAVDQSSQETRTFLLYDYIDEILISLRPKLKQVKHHISVNGDNTLYIETVPGALSQVVTNLIMNSLTHAYDKDEEGTISFDIEVEDKKVLLRYKDDGKGMDENIIKHIYEPFFTTRRGSGGSGLGLSIVYNLVTQTMGGTMSCQSELNKGTQFEMIFPVKINNLKVISYE